MRWKARRRGRRRAERRSRVSAARSLRWGVGSGSGDGWRWRLREGREAARTGGRARGKGWLVPAVARGVRGEGRGQLRAALACTGRLYIPPGSFRVRRRCRWLRERREAAADRRSREAREVAAGCAGMRRATEACEGREAAAGVGARRISVGLRMDAARSRGARRATVGAVVSSTAFCDARASLFADGVVHPIAFVEKAGRKHGDSCRHDDRKRLAGCSKRSVHEFLPLCAVCAPQRFHPVWTLLLTGSLANAYLSLTNVQVPSSDESSPQVDPGSGSQVARRVCLRNY